MAETTATHTPSVTARIQFSDLVPTGRSMVEVEVDDATVYCVRPGEMSEELMAEFNEHMAHATRSGRWLRPDTHDAPDGHPQD
ncbi:hypothetical protein AB0I87_04505 [Streptomyces sp. NPDC049952]|uniref:hypothetical protein n=1 Tax=Streptomyces TaxID=1883 RepID=UPI0034142479